MLPEAPLTSLDHQPYGRSFVPPRGPHPAANWNVFAGTAEAVAFETTGRGNDTAVFKSGTPAPASRARFCAARLPLRFRPVTPSGVRAVTLVDDHPPMIERPYLHVGALPDFAHLQNYVGLGEVAAVDELLYTLAADAEHAVDLCGPYEMKRRSALPARM